MSFQPFFSRLLGCAVAFVLLAHAALAQQNLFNIPSGAITPRGQWFFQQQLNGYALHQWAAKAHLVHGLGRGWELGMNVIDLNMQLGSGAGLPALERNASDAARPFKPTLLLTAQKGFDLGEHWAANLGTQIGFNLTAPRAQQYASYFHYALAVWKPKHHTRLIVGPYITNQYYAGPGNTLGYLLGFEYPITKKMLLMGDYISGTNAQSTGVLGVNYYLTKRVQLCVGGLLPSPGSGNKHGVVFELNLLSYDEE